MNTGPSKPVSQKCLQTAFLPLRDRVRISYGRAVTWESGTSLSPLYLLLHTRHCWNPVGAACEIKYCVLSTVSPSHPQSSLLECKLGKRDTIDVKSVGFGSEGQSQILPSHSLVEHSLVEWPGRDPEPLHLWTGTKARSPDTAATGGTGSHT